MEYRIVPGVEDVDASAERMVGRCEMFDEIACGGMATIHLGRMLGAGGFTRTVAIKRLHAQYAKDPEFVDMFLDEARIVARIRHPNVVPTLDLVEEEGDLFIIMEYVEGINLGDLLKLARKRKERVPLGIALRIAVGALHGLHAAHEATNAQGELMGLVHRDVSPDNILIGVDGFPRVLDFGVARAMGRLSTTRDGQVKGKLSHMAPEQVLGEDIDRRTDVFSTSTVLWQALTGKQLFKAKQLVELTHRILNLEIPAPSTLATTLPKKFDTIVLKGLERDLAQRWSSALAMAEAIEAVGHLASHREVGSWVRKLGSARLGQLATKVSALERKPITRRSRGERRVEQRSRLQISQVEIRDPRPAVDRSASQESLDRFIEEDRERNGSAVDSEAIPSSAAPSDDDSAEYEIFDSGAIPLPTADEAAGLEHPGPVAADGEQRRGATAAALVSDALPAAFARHPLAWVGAAAAVLLLVAMAAYAIGASHSDDPTSTAASAPPDPTAGEAMPAPAATATASSDATVEPAGSTEPPATAEPDSDPEDGAEPDPGTEAGSAAEEAAGETKPAAPAPKKPPRPSPAKPRPKPTSKGLYSRQ